MTNSNESKSEILVAKSPASWDTKYFSPEGYECQLRLNGDYGIELLEKANNAIEYLIKSGCQPFCPDTPSRSNQGDMTKTDNSHANEYIQGWDPSWCPVHQCHMKRRNKDGQAWYSHKANGTWCRGS